MWEKLEQIARRCAEIGELLTVPEIYGDAKELRRLTQEQKELEPVAQCYEDYRRAERTIAEATELLSDAELRDMAQEELRQAKADKERLYEELCVLLLPRDPNDGKTSSWSCAAAWAARRARSSQRTSTVCTPCTPKSTAGRSSF